MMFLSGVFFPLRAVADRWCVSPRTWLPLTNAVELVRPMFMDQWPAPAAAPRPGDRRVTTVVACWRAGHAPALFAPGPRQ